MLTDSRTITKIRIERVRVPLKQISASKEVGYGSCPSDESYLEVPLFIPCWLFEDLILKE